MNYAIRQMLPDELPVFFRLIEQDFPAGEYAPFEVLDAQMRNGSQEGLVLSADENDIAYAVNAVAENGFVLISLMAVSKELWGKGVGSAFIGMMKERYHGKKGIILEVERPDLAETPEKKDLMVRRILFYERLGFHIVPGIEYSIWDVPMHLMALPLTESTASIDAKIEEIITGIYLGLMGKRLIEKLSIRRVDL